MDSYSTFIAASRYARWLPEEGRRETWEETVDRYVDYMLKQAETKTKISKKHLEELKEIMG
jgi:ribonucleoside-diphosphate reductase alpha chain